jgi:hypothetical protein
MLLSSEKGPGLTFHLPEQVDSFKQTLKSAISMQYVPLVFDGIQVIPQLLKLGVELKKVIDVAVEARLFMLSHQDYTPADRTISTNPYDLPSCCRAFGVSVGTTPKHVQRLFTAICNEHFAYGIVPKDMLNRGAFMLAQARAYHTTKGFPIDVAFLEAIETDSSDVCDKAALHCNEQTGFRIYDVRSGTRPYFNIKEFERYLKSLQLLDTWERVSSYSNACSLREQTFINTIDSFASDYESIITPIYDARQTIKTLAKPKSKQLSNFVVDERSESRVGGYINPTPFPFYQKSSRTSPKPSLGFILNLQPWLRSLIQPKPGMAFVGCDWSKQEPVIAAHLSGDENLKSDLASDIYLATAKLLGPSICPADATKETHGLLRQQMKAITLGIQYGKGIKSLAVDFQAIFGLDEISAIDMATDLYDNHKARYAAYWDYVAETSARVRETGLYRSLDGWIYFVDSSTRPAQLQNLPMQANGAAIMRRGFIRTVESGLDVVCSLHDALYVNCSDASVEQTISTLKACMKAGVEDILGPGVEMGNDATVVRSGQHLLDARGIGMLRYLAEKSEALALKIHEFLPIS